ncbi:hypothetical protein GF339_17540 [candidate division KSB3 bacterium]|uniref:Beta-ketoacyl-[acyl-carrier-protein] synthase III N-terminal domain-containing protein n=1 Tax=candidate division KSB3 bacterium TaxID=2044937 RepID=A0A9D5JYZ6_9BACT|nr:hypothetical protein [candidate division KSB3 bacterium]MBD3326392.1 hypothetical protein [candidate division KSB3 bacterium]
MRRKTMKERDVFMAGIGSYSPGDPIPFDQIEDVLGRITEAPPKILRWIDRMRPIMKELLGVQYVHYTLDPHTRNPRDNNITMSSKAAQRALQQAGLKASEIDLLVFGGILMENICPPTSTLIQDALKIDYCAEFSIHSNCTSIYKAIQLAADLIANGRYNHALVITSQISSAILRAEYFHQQVVTKAQLILRWFLSDGAGACVLTSRKPDAPCLKIVDTYLESVGTGLPPSMSVMFGGNNLNLPDIYEKGEHHLYQDFKTVSTLAPVLGKKGWSQMVAKTGLDVSHVKWFLANIPTKHLTDLSIQELQKSWDAPHVQWYTRLSNRGYPGPPAIMIALDDFMQQDMGLSPGDLVVSFVTESSKWMHAGFILEYCA